MTSRDFGITTLRNAVAYHLDGSIVPSNNVYITSTNGAAVFSDTLTISTINASTINGGITLPSAIISMSTLTWSSSGGVSFASTIDTNVTVNSKISATTQLANGYTIASLNVVQNNWIIAVSPSNGSIQFILNGTVPSAGYDSSAQISWAVVG